jgi:branched-subunit amino acid transport protein AzlD
VLSTSGALLTTLVMGGAVLVCRFLPYVLFYVRRDRRKDAASPKDAQKEAAFFAFIEKAAPPAAMTVLAVHALLGPIAAPSAGSFPAMIMTAAPALLAALFTALLRLFKLNALLCIGGGTALYMVLIRLM